MTIYLAGCKQAQPSLNSFNPPRPRRAKVVFEMGATGTRKSKLSIDLATRFPAEIINSDKMKVYKGLNIVTNKVTEEEMCGVPHHLLGVLDPDEDFPATTISLAGCKQAKPSLNSFNPPRPRRAKVVFVMGATGTGKSKLAIDLATRFPAEIINSDKMQVYKGHNIVTNKVTEEEMCGVPHHLLGVLDPDEDFSATDFRHLASDAVESIVGRGQIPIIVGGSNSYIEALVDDDDFKFRSKYDCCFLWVDVSLHVLHSFVSKRVDQMVEAGLVDEVRRMFDPAAVEYSRGIRRAIGIPEMDQYLRSEALTVEEETQVRLLEEAINKIKENTCNLASCQLKKIHRLRSMWGWNLHRLDATDVFLSRGSDSIDAWEMLVRGRSTMIVGQFLCDDHHFTTTTATVTATITPPVMGTAVAAATH